MTDISTAYTAIRSRLDGTAGLIPLRYADDVTPLPDEPEAFARVEILTDRAQLAAFGGGAGNNLWRTDARIEAQVLIPLGTDEADGLASAEAIAAVFRGQSFSGLQCLAAEVYPGAVTEASGNYRGHLVTADFYYHRTA
jgi:hypothetical protein